MRPLIDKYGPWAVSLVLIGIMLVALAYAPDGADFIKAAAWPVVAVTVLIVLRDPITAQLQRLGNVTAGPVTLVFSEAINKELEKTAADAHSRGDQAADPTIEQAQSAGKIDKLVSDAELPLVRRQVMDLVAAYSRVRCSMGYGDEKTRAMGAVVSQMRVLGQAAFPLRHSMAFSRDPGERLATLSILQVQPDLDMLDWIAGRVSALEAPFVQYQALQALISAARLGNSGYSRQMRAAYDRAKSEWGRLSPDHRTERGDIFADLAKEVEWSEGS
jgi:hypothetical protein